MVPCMIFVPKRSGRVRGSNIGHTVLPLISADRHARRWLEFDASDA